MTLVDRPSSTFTTQELQRLEAYRAAVAAGFYTDWPDGMPTTDAEAEADPPQPDDEAEPPVRPAADGSATPHLSGR